MQLHFLNQPSSVTTTVYPWTKQQQWFYLKVRESKLQVQFVLCGINALFLLPAWPTILLNACTGPLLTGMGPMCCMLLICLIDDGGSEGREHVFLWFCDRQGLGGLVPSQLLECDRQTKLAGSGYGESRVGHEPRTPAKSGLSFASRLALTLLLSRLLRPTGPFHSCSRRFPCARSLGLQG